MYAADLSERDRAFLARHVEFRATSDGLVALGGDEAVNVAAPVTLSFSPDGAGGLYGRFELAHTGCAAASPVTDEGAFVGRRCVPGTGMEFGVEGTDSGFVQRLLTQTEIHDVRERR